MDNFFDNNSEQNTQDVGTNFFSSNSKPETEEDNSLNNQYDNLKNNYEQIFIEAAESIRREIAKFKPENPCESCSAAKDCQIKVYDIFTPYPANCKYREWQLQTLTFLAGDYQQTLKAMRKNIYDKHSDYSCGRCGACCKLATSEYSYTQLKQRASKGDKYASDFISVFVPYENEDDARKVNPEFCQMLDDLLEDQRVYFYYCPKVKDNLCSDYENRPDVCKNFPYNPLKLLPKSCTYNGWKNEVAHQAMLLKAKCDIIDFYKEKLG